MKTTTYLMLIPVGLMAVGGLVVLSNSPSNAPPEPSAPLMRWNETSANSNLDPGKDFARKLELEAKYQGLLKAREDEEAQEKFDASPAGIELRELKRRVEEAERQANMALGIAISRSNSTH